MTRLVSLMVASIFAVGALGCTKPTEEDCRKALANMRRLMGTDNMRDDGRLEGEVRRCRGGSKKKAVDCAVKAQTLDDLRHCEFFHVPEGAKGLPDDHSSGSAPNMGSAGSGAAPGSAAPTGSAATGPGSASGSAAPTGSAASPGAAAGSAATSAGSAVGSAK